MTKKIFCLMALAILFVGCSNDDDGGSRPKERKKIELSRSEQVMTEETTDFAFRFFQQVLFLRCKFISFFRFFQQALFLRCKLMYCEKIRPHLLCQQQRLLQAPFPDSFMVSRPQHLRDSFALIDGRLCVMRVFQEPVFKGFFHRTGLPQAPRQQTDDRIDDHLGREFSARQDIIADGDHFVRMGINAGVHPLIMAADQDQMIRLCKFMGLLLGIRDPRRSQDDRLRS